ncbi:hypothetical protein FC95_GL001483 [Lentilactobacillus kefiri DSM 20587 = JCM 5818]|uniref:Uncharacterized protein n=2 Tax=Lentilactobacillus kefiri TaxID=33962 RepID=A0A8E1V0M3_LENKE|nr:hypothetical protein FD08_GL004263 [Lentilactobacillus parakefiri DSM 10551]KRM51649.1 hypothetical protein FC95_GL001483 [Lentilactobacillus kefiri DSM 20587 = JCM 5818]
MTIMNKGTQLLAATIVSLGFLGAATTTQAATWHHGTPAALRGDWKDKTINIGKRFGIKKWYSYESAQVKKTSVRAHLTQSTGWYITNTKWKYVGSNAYMIVGTNEISELPEVARFTFKRVGHSYVHIYYNGRNIAKDTPFSPYFYRVSKRA